ncbi:Patatin-like phospholipase domain-containing protein 4 [Liparis tanakae]|uniref:Patatin-like phospholipase domain-containing protein 4 n=1 Tax=Liparis tanakae TaxID=230148 RepID=A0A4Z2EGR7_9TELE|nr:Patatin-like phospholipase domain-containing protein 4 [Liparis tanakae]
MLPSQAHRLATGRLHVSMTHYKSGENYILSTFNSREELITALLASSYVPVYAGLKPVELRGQAWTMIQTSMIHQADGGREEEWAESQQGHDIRPSRSNGPYET